MQIALHDNQYKAVSWENAVIDLDGDNNLSDRKAYLEVLKRYSGKTLKDLARNKDFGNFLIFSSKNSESELDDGQKLIYELVPNSSGLPRFRTGNIMGFLSLVSGSKKNDVQLQITSRFDDEKNFFLHYMLQKVCNVAFAPPTQSGVESSYDFLYYLFPSYLNEACRQGIFRAYVKRKYNDANIRGPVDVPRHIRFNIPFNGKIAYSTRDYTINNKITQLIRHTIEYIRSRKLYAPILEGDARDNVNDIVSATPTYSKNARRQVIAQNLQPVVHPYYTAYEPLRKLCLGILLHEKLNYGANNKPITGILFDGASLWEEYLATIFKKQKLDLVHSNNRTGNNGIPLLEGGRKNHYPDFYRIGAQEKKAIVLDAKYKRLCEKKSPRENAIDNAEADVVQNGNVKCKLYGKDVMQMLAYMYALKSEKAVLISPYIADSIEDDIIKMESTACGYGGNISVIAVPIWTKTESREQFESRMKIVEVKLVEEIKAVLAY